MRMKNVVMLFMVIPCLQYKAPVLSSILYILKVPLLVLGQVTVHLRNHHLRHYTDCHRRFWGFCIPPFKLATHPSALERNRRQNHLFNHIHCLHMMIHMQYTFTLMARLLYLQILSMRIAYIYSGSLP